MLAVASVARTIAWLAATVWLGCDSGAVRPIGADQDAGPVVATSQSSPPSQGSAAIPPPALTTALKLTLTKARVQVGETIRAKLSPEPSIGDDLEIALLDPATGERIPGMIWEHETLAPHVVPPHAGHFDLQVSRAGRTLASTPVEVIEPGGRIRMKLADVTVCKLHSIEVMFGTPLPHGRLRLELVPAGSPEGTQGKGQTLRVGATRAQIQLNGKGDWEVRLYDEGRKVLGRHRLKGYYCAT
jgi:hypothetical protein